MAKQKTAPKRSAEAPAVHRPLNVASVARIQQPGQRFSQVLGSDPVAIAQALRAAERGENEGYLQLAVEMPERYLHFGALLDIRLGSIVAEDIDVEPGDDSELAQRIADLFRTSVVDQPQFEDMCRDLLSAVVSGYAAVQPHWDTTGPVWTYAEYEFIDPRYFVYDRETLSQLRMRCEGTVDGLEIPPGQFIIHRPKLKTGIPCRAGLARPAAVGYLFHCTTVRQWAALVDVWGFPLRIGTYKAGVDTTPQEIDELRTAVLNIGHDAAALLPDSCKLEVLDARRPTSGNNIYQEFVDYWDKSLSKLVVGGTMNTDDGSSLSQARVHAEVRSDIKRSDIKQLNATLTAQVARPWCLHNFGPNAPAPRVKFNYEPPEDLQALSAALTPLINAGLRVKADELRAKFGLENPADGDEIVGESLPTSETPTPKPKPLPPNSRQTDVTN